MNIFASDGSSLQWSISRSLGPDSIVLPGTAMPITVTLSPLRPGHLVDLEYRLDGGPVRQINLLPAASDPISPARAFQAVLPAQLAGVVEFLPVLLDSGKAISPRLAAAPELASRYRVGQPAARALPLEPLPPREAPAGPLPQWAWSSTFLGTLRARLSKEVVGPTPDGLRINWHVVEGSLIGPGLQASVLPGATDWMRIREDGVAIVNVLACFQTDSGAKIFGSYGGYFDLGPEGFNRALRNQFDPHPPVVVTPTYATAAPELAWLNRVQCVGVGRVNMSAQEVEFDVYTIQVGGRLPSTAPDYCQL